MEGESALITKLHAKLSLFRRDRDDAHRQKELSVERLRIVRKDREAAAAEVRAMQSKLLEMREGTKRKIGEVAVVEKEVDGLRMEVRYLNFWGCCKSVIVVVRFEFILFRFDPRELPSSYSTRLNRST